MTNLNFSGRSLRRFTRRLASSLLLVSGLCGAVAHADQIDDHNALVARFIGQDHAEPLVADCAAHAAYVVPTSPSYDRVEFADQALDPQHATVQPWSEPFGTGKQRISVDTVVTVDGQGFRKGADDGTPDALTFRCGYLDSKLLAFEYNEPRQAVTASGGGSRGHGRRTHASARRGHRTTAHVSGHTTHVVKKKKH
ncbi:MAG: BspC domain-containing protein [Janthinobacterium lividum]